MIDAIAGVGDRPADLFETRTPGGELGKDQFLELLVAQLQHQDPLSPMEADQLAVQLAQFSSVEQLIEINDQIGALGAFDGQLAESVATSTAVGLIGKDVRAAVNRVTLDGTGAPNIDIDVPPAGGHAYVRIFDASGQAIGELDAGQVAPGLQSIDLSPLDAQLPPGTYGISVEIADPRGNAVETTASVIGQVSGVRYGASGPVLAIGSLEFPLASVIEVRGGS